MKLANKILTGAAIVTMAMFGLSGEKANAANKKDTISYSEINTFVAELNTKLESQNANIGLFFLEDHADANLLITNRVKNYTTQNYKKVLYTNNGYAYRYPTAYYEPRTSVQYTYSNLGKADWINDFLIKKSAWAGYKPVFNIKSRDRDASRKKAYVKVDLREYTLTYDPYAPQHYGQKASAAADCEMKLEKRFGEMKITGLTCEYSRHFSM